MKTRILAAAAAALMLGACTQTPEKTATATPEDGRSNQEILFDDGNYAMFIHFGLYSKLEGEWKGKLYFGNAEWIMNQNQAAIPVDEYMAEAATFDPSDFDAKAIVELAKAAGMKYIVITSKHHEGFAMFDSDACDFNIHDATPLRRDLMKELADACHEGGIGIGFYYSQWQDWTAPGGGSGPEIPGMTREEAFEKYFREKCIPQVNELTTKYGEIQVIWFDTPGSLSPEFSKELVDLVRKNQPGALVSSRVGNDMGDYETLGDMQVPVVNHNGRWEGIDVVQVGWGFSRFDSEWKSPEYIVRTLVSTVARGGTFMFNIGPDARGRIPEEAQMTLRKSGEWVHRYPQTVYGAQASPWGHALPWGDAVVQGDRICLIIYDWPRDGRLWVPGLSSRVGSARLMAADGSGKGKRLKVTSDGDWSCISVPAEAPDRIASVIELSLNGEVSADSTLAVAPNCTSELPIALAQAKGCEIKDRAWMVKFGEWKFKTVAEGMSADAEVSWDVEFKEPGYYQADVEFTGNGLVDFRLIDVDGAVVVDRKKAGNDYGFQSLGWLYVGTAGTHTIRLGVSDADYQALKVSALRLSKVDL